MYYYPLYLIGYFLLAYAVIVLICRIWKRLEAPVKKTIAYGKRNGVKAAFLTALERVDRSHRDKMSVLAADYEGCREWSVPLAMPALMREREAQAGRRFACEPLISIVVPAYEPDEAYFEELLASVRNQTYAKWELIIADASVSRRVEAAVNRALEKEKEASATMRQKIRYIRLEENKGISDNTNAGIEAAGGDYIALLDHDDILTLDALYSMVEKLNEAAAKSAGRNGKTPGRNGKISGESGKTPGGSGNPSRNILAVYSDEDKCDGAAERFYEPHFKPDFNLDLLLSNNYICHFLMVEASVMKRLKLRGEYDGAQDYDLLLRLAGLAGLAGGESRILHVPKVLYHWRCHEGSTAGNTESKRYAYDAGRRALEAYYEAQGMESGVRVTDSEHLGFYRTEYTPDLFAVRKDVAAVCGRVVCKGVVVGSPEGMFDGLRARGSGYMHRASLYMEVKEGDPRALRLRPDLGCSLSEALARGMKLVYDPAFIVRIMSKK